MTTLYGVQRYHSVEQAVEFVAVILICAGGEVDVEMDPLVGQDTSICVEYAEAIIFGYFRIKL